MLLCDRCRTPDRGDRPVEPFAIVAGSLGLTANQYELSLQLCPDCQRAIRAGLETLAREYRSGQRPRDDR